MADSRLVETRKLSVNSLAMVTTHLIYKLGIADRLREAPKTSEELAGLANVLAPKLHRVLLFVESMNVLKRNEAGQWELTDLGHRLIGEKPHPSIILNGMPSSLDSYAKFTESLTSEKTSHEIASGMSFFDYMQAHPEEDFDQAMRIYTNFTLPPIIANIDLSNSQRVMDVGGGIGTLICACAQKFPHFTGAICEQPSVLPQARTYVDSQGLTERIQLIEGDFFKSVPSGYDTIMMKSILHDWNDELCIQILKNCRAVQNPGDKLIIVDIVMDRSSPFYKAQRIADIGMMCTADGKERTTAEFRSICESSGYRVEQIVNCELISLVYGVAT